VKIVAISPRPSDDEAAAITIALARLHAERAHGSVHLPSRWRREPKLAATPELKLGYHISDPTWHEAARLEALDGGV
jgi:hypothetical protein